MNGNWSTHHLVQNASLSLGEESAANLGVYISHLRERGVAPVATLGHLAQIVGVEYSFLRSTVQRNRERSNYKVFFIGKRNGGDRLIHSVTSKLFLIQRFVNDEILQKIQPHQASYAFHPSGGIRKCANVHCGARWLFSFDISNFFYQINEIDVYEIFREIGYTQLLSFELSRLCTTIYLPSLKHRKYLWNKNFHTSKIDYSIYNNVSQRIGCLAQGSPTSPMLSNLAARGLDESLNDLAKRHGLVYTRYADDLVFSSGSELNRSSSVGRIRSEILNEVRGFNFEPNLKKTRIAGPGTRKVVLGLLVDGPEPRLTKAFRKKIERHLYIATKFGIKDAAEHEKFRSAHGYYNYIRGLIGYVKDVDETRWNKYKQQFDQCKL